MRERVEARLPSELLSRVEQVRKCMGKDATFTDALEVVVNRGLRRTPLVEPVASVTQRMNLALAGEGRQEGIPPALAAAQWAILDKE